MPPINFIFAAVVALGFLTVLRAYLPLMHSGFDRFAFYVIRGVMVGAFVGLMRLGYWDGVQYLSGDHWPEVRAFFGGQKISTVFNGLLLFTVRDLLKARVELVPEDERHRWRWWTVAAHPAEKCVFDWRTKK